ncbi:MAG: diaminopimelate epimerase [Candidatus Omnitrophota bacterium]
MAPHFGPSIRFYKAHGCGNDFVAIDNRELALPVEKMPEWARKICQRAFGVYADGLFFLENAPAGEPVDYRWHFYNSDGSRAEMCGNASRCAARLAYELGIAPAEHTLGTDAGPVHARVFPDSGQVEVQLMPAIDMKLNLEIEAEGKTLHAHFVTAGVPHAVVYCDPVGEVDIKKMGPALRYHNAFAPEGANANFVQVKDKNHLLLRTYERGVEAETYACGTGACAAAFISRALGLTDESVIVTTTGGEQLTVTAANGRLLLQGGAEIVFSGELYLNALGL